MGIFCDCPFFTEFADKTNSQKLQSQNILNKKIKMFSKCIIIILPQKLETQNITCYLFRDQIAKISNLKKILFIWYVV